MKLRRRFSGSLAAIGLAVLMVMGSSVPAQAVDMMAISGNIICRVWFPLQFVKGTTTAKGDVALQLNALNNPRGGPGTIYVDLGYSSTLVPWGYTFFATQGGNMYAYGLGSIGKVTKIGRSCV